MDFARSRLSTSGFSAGAGFFSGVTSSAAMRGPSSRWSRRPLRVTTAPASRCFCTFVNASFQIITSIVPVKSSTTTIANGLPSFFVNFRSTDASCPAMVTMLLLSCDASFAMGTYFGFSSALRYSSSGWPVT